MESGAAFRVQAAACRELGSPMYGELLDRAAADIDAGGPVAEVLEGHEDDPGPSALALRLLGSVHRLVLERRAGGLAAFYPSVGGTWEVDGGWRAFRELLVEQPDAVREWLDRAPQTNEVGRAAALYGGLLHVERDLPLRLFEIGSSGGLNLLADRFGYVDDTGSRFGAATSDVVLDHAWHGRRLRPWPDLEVVERVGSDLHPVDTSTTEGRLALTAYVWPDQRTRLERLRAALREAAADPPEVRRQDARSFVAGLEPADGTTTVLWHSVMWQYLPPADRDAITARLEELGAAATGRRRLVHLRAEPARRAEGGEHEFLVRLRSWPDGDDQVLGTMAAHGTPVTWE
ncbi:MAG TPA: DUF2332 domain-containing protein [Marmoricola sp.]|nr:DUF2332 domain-containing protein [Marmoricola sp.]